MANRVRRRNREELRTSEDLLAVEPDIDFASAGPHFPMFVTSTSTASRDSDEDDEEIALLREEREYESKTVDPNIGWFKRTRETLRGDFSSICLLLFLYLLQGVPLGLISAIPLLLQDKQVSYGGQAIFSFAYWPFSLKLLWAPIVDSVFWRRIGRRKSWMVPCQYLIGLFMLGLSWKAPVIMGETEPDSTPNVFILMMLFLPLNFFAATQDIAVDGWALTILSRKNVGYASTCNAVGQTIGYFMGNIVFLTLESKDIANYFRAPENQQSYGFVSLSGYLFFWGLVFIVSTTLVLILKKEVDNSQEPQVDSDSGDSDEKELEMGIFETYGVLWKIMCLRPMIYMTIILLTGKMAFAATDGITGLKLIGLGIPKDRLASFGLFLTPLQVMLPWVIGKWTAGPRPLNIFLMAYPYRIVVGGIYAALVWWTPSFRSPEGTFSGIIYVIWILGYMLHQVASYGMFVSMMAFNAQVSDPRIGGTYMTLLNTLNNLGGNWPVTLVLSITDFFTKKECFTKGTKSSLFECNSKALADQCSDAGDVCEVVIDGYFITVAICTVIGIIWYKLFFNKIKYLQKIPRKEWNVIKK